MRYMGIQSMHQRGTLDNDANPRVATAVNAPLMTLGQTKPTLQFEVVFDLLERAGADEQAGGEAVHDLGHVLMHGIPHRLEAFGQCFKLLLALGAIRLIRVEGRGYFRDVLGVFPDRRLLGPNFVQSSVDAAGQTAELLLREPPFFSSKFRWIDSRTSVKASAIRKPGG